MEKLVTTKPIMSVMNAVVAEEREQDQGQRDTVCGTTGTDPDGNPGQIQVEIQGENPVESREEPPDENLEESQSVIQEGIAESAEEIAEESAEEEVEQPRITTRSGREIVRPSQYAAVTRVLQKEWQQEQAKKEIKK
jgi:hypothetical protein